ncbi:MAG: hypothetical protein ACHQEM_05550, partial [Chitinophagales bacterium]
MKNIIVSICFFGSIVIANAQNNSGDRSRPFDAGWRFMRDSTIMAETAAFNDSKWRVIHIPHDWSIEDLSAVQPSIANQTSQSRVGPFDKGSVGKSATGFTVGGTGWYRRK